MSFRQLHLTACNSWWPSSGAALKASFDLLRTAVRQNFLDFEVLANPDHQLFSYLVTDGRRILRFVIITAFQRSKRTAWSRVPPVFKGPGNLTLVSLPSRDVFVSPSLSSGSENHVWSHWLCSGTPDFRVFSIYYHVSGSTAAFKWWWFPRPCGLLWHRLTLNLTR